MVQSKSKSKGVKSLSQHQFWFRVSPPNAGHHPAAHIGRDNVSHEKELALYLVG